MPIRQVPASDLEYSLICYDKDGRERLDGAQTYLSDDVIRAATDPAAAITDVFFLSHGWKGDVPAAIEQYNNWIGVMARAEADRAAMRQRRPGFQPLLVGLHWPSQPWGDEGMTVSNDATSGLLSSGTEADEGTVGALVDLYAERVADTPAARTALRTIFAAAARDGDPGTLPPEVIDAYYVLNAESGLGSGDVTAPPGDDRDGFDPEGIYQDERAETAGDTAGLLGGGGGRFQFVLSPLRQLSFWRMKDRARRFGVSGGHDLLCRILEAAPTARVHLMGHSFGCIVVSAALVGAPNAPPLPRAVDSLFLVQGALSLWSYCADVPYARGTPGYFNRILRDELVRGPIVTTRSQFDTAVGRYYPLGAQLGKQLVLSNELPKYGGIGSFGAQGIGSACEDLPMGPVTYEYGFELGRVYNLEASTIIAKRDGASGAHSDIAHPEVAHAAWAAALTTA